MADGKKHLKSVKGGTGGWDTDDGYSKSHFYTASADDNGHSAYARVRLKEHLKTRLNEVLRSAHFPALRTEQDFIRDAIYHRLHDLEEMTDDPRIQDLLREEIGRARFLAKVHQERLKVSEYKRMSAEVDSFLDETSKEPNVYIRARLEDFCEQAKGDLEEPFRTRLVQRIERYLSELAD